MDNKLEYIDNVELLKKTVHVGEYDFPIGENAWGEEEFAALAQKIIGRATQEKFLVCMFNPDGIIIGYSIMNKGDMVTVQIDLFSTFRTALFAGANRIAISHNHPSGTPIPSEQDLNLTMQFIKASKILQIELLDHVVVTDELYTSIRAQVGEAGWVAAQVLL